MKENIVEQCEQTQDVEVEVSVVETKPEETGSSNVYSGALNMFNSVVGVGIFTYPLALILSGIQIGVFLMFFCCALVYYTSTLMIEGKDIAKEKGIHINNYAELAFHSIGKQGYFIICNFIYIMMIAAMIIYCILFRIILNEVVSDFMNEEFEFDQALLLGTAVFILLPIILQKDMSKLASASFFSTIAVFVIILMVAIRLPVYSKKAKNLSKSEIITISNDLVKDRSLFMCGIANSLKGLSSEDVTKNVYKIVAPISQETNKNGNNGDIFDKVTNQKTFFEQLNKAHSKDCSAPIKKEKIEKFVDEIKLRPLCAKNTACSNNCSTCSNFKSAIVYAYARQFYDKYSITPEGAKVRNFNLNGFARIGFFYAISVFAAGFICQQTVFSIYRSLKNQDHKTQNRLMLMAYAAILVASILLGVYGAVFGDYQTGDFVFSKMRSRFLGIKSPDYVVNIAKILVVLTIVLTYPMQFFFSRVSLISFIEYFATRYTRYDKECHGNYLFYFITIFMQILTVLVGTLVDDIFFVYSIIGSLCASPLVYAFPVIIIYQYQGGMFVTLKQEIGKGFSRSTVFKVILPMFTLIFGIITTFLSTIFAITEKYGATNLNKI